MDWQIRHRYAIIDPKKLYATGSDKFSIKLYHGGRITGITRRTYIGGAFDFVDMCDVDKISVEELKSMVRELGHTYDVLFFYVEPGGDVNSGLKSLRSDADILKMCQWVPTNKLLDVYSVKDVTRATDEISASNSDKKNQMKKHMKMVVNERSSNDEKNDDEGSDSDSSNDDDRFTEDNEYCQDEEILEGLAQEKPEEGNTEEVEQSKSEEHELHDVFLRNSQLTQTSNMESVGLTSKQQRNNREIAQTGSTKNDFLDILDENMEDDQLQNIYGSSDDEDGSTEVGYIDFNAEKDMRQPKFQLKMRFSNSTEFKKAIKNYSIWQRKPVKFTTNERHRVRAKCAPGCPWVCYASIVKSSGTNNLIVKTLVDTHANCDHVHKNRHLTAKWVAARYEERVRANMNIKVGEIRQTVDEDQECSISKVVAYNARKLARESIIGSAAEQYAHIWEYCDEIHRTHPNSTMVVEHTPFRNSTGNPRFMRLYCCLGPLKEGFKLCRSVIGLDGCHIKGAYPGQLLSAIGVDPNNGWWPIAWAVVEKEATTQWKWFIELLRDDLLIENQFHFTFISDQQKGLARALSEILPNSEHRYCVQHLHRNFKKKHPGKVLKNMIWAIARSSNIQDFNKAMESLEEYDSEAFKWVKKAPHPSHWCKAFFNPSRKSDLLTNNLCESFNSYILEARDKPILSLMENVRVLMMERIQKRKDSIARYDHPTGPLIRKIVEDRVKESFCWKPIFNGVDGYQVRGLRGAQFAVDLRLRDCTCGLWEISGLPCCHAVAALKHRGLDVHSCSHDCYKRELFISVYENVLYPINGVQGWPRSASGLTLDPPVSCVQPGRPKKARRRDVDEGKNHGTKLRKIVQIHCSKCGLHGHNAATCKNLVVSNESAGSNSPQQPQQIEQQMRERPKKLPAKRKAVQGQRPSEQVQVTLQGNESQMDTSSNLNPTQTQPLRRSPRKLGTTPLTDGDKCRINANCAWLGKPIPYTVGGWKRGGGVPSFGRGKAKRGTSAK